MMESWLLFRNSRILIFRPPRPAPQALFQLDQPRRREETLHHKLEQITCCGSDFSLDNASPLKCDARHSIIAAGTNIQLGPFLPDGTPHLDVILAILLTPPLTLHPWSAAGSEGVPGKSPRRSTAPRSTPTPILHTYL